MRIVHTSDLHGRLFNSNGSKLPAADLYVVSGDMLPNDPLIVFENRKTHEQRICKWEEGSSLPMTQWLPVSRKIDPLHEITYQTGWINDILIDSYVRERMFTTEEAPVICVRGNHDFVDLKPLFEGVRDDNTFELHEPGDVIELFGLRIGGMRGIPYIYGEWCDEYRQPDADDRCRRLPLDLDVLITHAPPYGVLDNEPDHYGMRGLRSYLDRARNLKAHLFGHIHAHGGKVEHLTVGYDDSREDVTMSNAATSFTVLDL